MYTLNKIVTLLRDYATAHGQINDFEFQPDYRDGSERQLLYPLLACDIVSNSIGSLNENNRVDDSFDFEFRILDLVKNDNSNETDVLSDCNQIAKDLIAYLRQTRFLEYLTIDTSTTMERVRYTAPDDCAGWVFKIGIKQGLDLDLCGAPVIDAPAGPAPNPWSPTNLTVNWGNIDGTLSNQTDLQAALDAKVPTSRALTINGVTYDLSANRSWTISAGGETLAQTLALGNSSGAYNIVMNDDYGITLGSLAAGSLKYVSGTQSINLSNANGGQSITLSDTGDISLSTLTASRVVLTDSNNLITTSANITYDGTTFNNGSAYINLGNYASPTNLRAVTIGQDTAYCSIGSRIGTASQVAFYGNQATPSSSNWFLITDGSALSLNATAGQLALQTNNTNRYTIASTTGVHTWTTGTAPGTATTFFNWTAGNSTTQTASTAIPKAKMTFGNTQWGTGALTATQKAFDFTQPTMSFVGASTSTLAATIGITGAYSASTNATITTSVGLLIEGGAVNGGGTVTTAYGAYFNTPTGASTNYALGISGSVLTIGSDGTNSITFRSGANNRGHVKSTSGTITFQISSLNSIPLALAVDGTTYLSLTSTDLTFSNAVNMIFNTSTGTKIGTATNQKIGLWNATPIVQPTTAVAAATLTGGGGTNITDTDTFDGYTLKQIVKALRNIGLLA